jgi:probable rRNA maturation factor
MSESDPLVEFLIEEAAWKDALPDLEQIAETATNAAFAETGLDAGSYSISLLACGDTRIAALNKSFRGKETPTNVLSWPAFELAPQAPGARTPKPGVTDPNRRVLLGDVAIALQTCTQESKVAGKCLKNHTTHLILHGVLHLLGYDHQTDADAELMEGIERAALAKAGIDDPYI